MKNTLELYLSLYPLEYKRKSDLFYRTNALVFLLFALATVVFSVFSNGSDGSLPQIYFFALIGMLFPGSLQNISEGLDAGAFGERLKKYGTSVWKAAVITVPVIGYPSLLVMGYALIGQLEGSGEPVEALAFLFGAGILGLSIWSVLDIRKRYLRVRERSVNE